MANGREKMAITGRAELQEKAPVTFPLIASICREENCTLWPMEVKERTAKTVEMGKKDQTVEMARTEKSPTVPWKGSESSMRNYDPGKNLFVLQKEKKALRDKPADVVEMAASVVKEDGKVSSLRL